MWLDPGIGKLGVKRGLVQPRLLPLLLIHYMVTQLLRGQQMDLGLKTLELDPLLGTLLDGATRGSESVLGTGSRSIGLRS